ncbi:zinc ribbon domain-containing protein [uncultured Fibrobacter sp.]|uniref:double zinc ribbon domain-containing protein n=1 Tax=uncultured Fibrobacter sp. TaxID=261512 RepID=UPI00345BF177
MICPKCMATNDADADKCRRCGCPLGAGNKCPHCGSKISTPVKFCTNCGKKLPEKCSYCSGILTENAKFCIHCGKKVK